MSTIALNRILRIAFVGLETLFAGSFICAIIYADNYYGVLSTAGILTALSLASVVPLAFVSFLLRRAHPVLAAIGGCTILAVILYVVFIPNSLA